MTTDSPPTVREVLAGYRLFNAWEVEDKRKRLSDLSVSESLTQYFQLQAMVRSLAPDADRAFSELDKARWIAWKQKRQQAARIMGYASHTKE